MNLYTKQKQSNIENKFMVLTPPPWEWHNRSMFFCDFHSSFPV